MRWSPQAVAAATGGQTEGTADEILDGVAIDSRQLQPGALFVAIRAERDGHDWINAAIAAGAAGLLVERGRRGVHTSSPVIEVADTAAALLALGAAARDRLAATVIGVTGSVGKTSTKDLAAAALGAGVRTTASEKSFNNELGVPLTLANAPLDAGAAVIEMGARGPGHIARLCQVARPTIGVVTAVVAAHTEVFGDLDSVAAAKAELVEALPAEGTAILNADDGRVLAMADRTGAASVTYSAGGAPNVDVAAEDVQLDEELRPRFVVRSAWGVVTVQLGARGVHQVGNALAALAVAGCCGVPMEAAAAALAAPPLSPWRMELGYSPAGAVILNDAYNANPASMAAALQALAALPATRRIAVLGEMAELGERRTDEHHQIVQLAARLGVEVVVVSTDAYGMRPLAGIDAAIEELGPLGRGDAVLVKASRVAALERLAARLVAG
ncbi:MAG TPA: UDP-N-acetylmuramoyl-tripeptide--D-alanyl-D-alanine ligase [Acidimicrobiales bacterium]|jgi:UDP-N-acetylmuramoyl-tripeptide--D-alanyl-D-alanine ligase